MTRTAEVWRGIGAITVLVCLLLGFPIALYAVGGSPLLDYLPTWTDVSSALMQPDTDHTLFLRAIRLIGWSAWLLFAVLITTETASYLAGHPIPSLPRPVRPAQHLARDLVAMTALIFTTSTTLANAVEPPSAHAEAAEAETLRTKSPSFSDIDAPAAARHDIPTTTPPEGDSKRPNSRTRTIKPGDTLWDIARRHYGSGGLYPRIFKASRDLDQPQGVPPLTRPSRLFPGQRIRIPLSTHEDTPHRRQTETTPPRDDARAPSASASATGTPAATPSGPTTAGAEPTQAKNPTPTDRALPTVTLPSGAHVGIGLAAALSLAVAMTRLHHRRRRTLNDEAWPGPTTADPTPPATVTKVHKAHLDSRAEHGEPIPTDIELVIGNQRRPTPEHITLGTLRGNPVALPLAGLSIGFDGDGALAALRAITTDLLANARHDRFELVIPEHDAQRFYPGLDIADLAADLPGLTLRPTLNAAITHLEGEIIRRARLLDTADVPDLPSLRTADPAEPLPTLVVLGSVPDEASHRLHAVIQLGHRYGIGALISGSWPHGTTACLTEDGTVTNAQGPQAEHLVRARLFHLTADDAAAMLQPLRTAAGKPEPTPQAPINQPPAPSLIPPQQPTAQEQQSLVQLLLLGPVRLRTADGLIDTGLRRSSKSLLAYLALHPDGITRDQGSAALWPDHSPENATTLFHTAVSNIRKVLRHATGLREPMFIIHAASRYRLDPHLIDVDLWRLSTALEQARRADNDPERTHALSPLTSLYTGDFATDLTDEWAEAHREFLRRTAIDALAHLAHLAQDDHPDQALATLEHALRHDPYSEPLYRSIMKLQARLDRPDAVRRTYQLLTTRLNELDTEPDEQTHQLITNLQRHAPTSERSS
ncbi:BTAD domain-containing putative transcriptional regulator [Actinomadura sp. SCN-SB]|uniref:BTAD domain-containing putative transcriptional regulator n=1 Tax=Actinomadura sp. SCN-SB TaxID=3373092 RepID=UPI0037501CA0